MKKSKIIPAILGLCLTLNVTGAAVAPELGGEIKGTAGEATDLTTDDSTPALEGEIKGTDGEATDLIDDDSTPALEKEIQETMLTYSLSIEKDIPAVLRFFTNCLQKGKKTCNGVTTFDHDLIATVAQYLTYYIYTLYPRGISMGERMQLISFFEMNLAKYGLSSELKNEFFCALESAPVERSTYFLDPKAITIRTCDHAIQILARSPKSGIRFVINVFKQQLSEPANKYSSGENELVRSFTYFVYTLYSRPLITEEEKPLCTEAVSPVSTEESTEDIRPLNTEDLSMLEEMYAKFNSCQVPKSSITSLKYAIEHAPHDTAHPII